MALATNSTPGSIVIAGDLTGTSSDIQLKPSGVTAGEYTNPTIVVDQKGRVIYALDNPPPTNAATEEDLGLIKIGDGLEVEVDGTLNVVLPDATTTSKGIVQAGSGTTVIDGVLYVEGGSDATTSTKGIVQVGSGLSVTDGVISTSLVDATTSTKGVVQVGSGLSVASGVVSAAIPDATTSTKGVVQVGSGLSVSGGVVNAAIPDATTSTKGVVQVGSGLSVTGGVISTNIPDATTSVKGVVQVGSGLAITNGLVRAAIPDATTSTKGVVQVGAGLDISAGTISGVNATTSSKGVVEVGAGLAVAAGVISAPSSSSSEVGVVQLGTNMVGTPGTLGINTATTGAKGVVRVGSGLDVSAGVVSVSATWLSGMATAAVIGGNEFTAAQRQQFGYRIVESDTLPTGIEGDVVYYRPVDTGASYGVKDYAPAAIEADIFSPCRVEGLSTATKGSPTGIYCDGDCIVISRATAGGDAVPLCIYPNGLYDPGVVGPSAAVATDILGVGNGLLLRITGGNVYTCPTDGSTVWSLISSPPIFGEAGFKSYSKRVVYFKGYYYLDVASNTTARSIVKSSDCITWTTAYTFPAASTSTPGAQVGTDGDVLTWFFSDFGTLEDSIVVTTTDGAAFSTVSGWDGPTTPDNIPLVVSGNSFIVNYFRPGSSLNRIVSCIFDGTTYQPIEYDYDDGARALYVDFDGIVLCRIGDSALGSSIPIDRYIVKSSDGGSTWQPVKLPYSSRLWRWDGKVVGVDTFNLTRTVPWSYPSGWIETNDCMVYYPVNDYTISFEELIRRRLPTIKITFSSSTKATVTYF